MAMSSMIRKAASHIVVPFALRAIASPRILSSPVIMADHRVEESTFCPHHSNFSTVSDATQEVIRAVEFEHPSPMETRLPSIPTGFPFKIEDIPGENEIRLKREFAGEKIVVEVQNPIYSEGRDVSYSGDSSTDCSDDEESEKRCVNISHDTYIPLHVNISKANGRTLKLVFTANARYIDPYEIYFIDEGKGIYHEVKIDQKEFWRAFIRVRGIREPIGEFLIEYMTRRQDRDYLHFFNKFSKFVE